ARCRLRLVGAADRTESIATSDIDDQRFESLLAGDQLQLLAGMDDRAFEVVVRDQVGYPHAVRHGDVVQGVSGLHGHGDWRFGLSDLGLSGYGEDLAGTDGVATETVEAHDRGHVGAFALSDAPQ